MANTVQFAAPDLFDAPTRLGDVDAAMIDQTRPEEALPRRDLSTDPKFNFDVSTDNEQTRMASIDSIARKHPPPPRSSPRQQDERTRAVDIRNDPNMPNMNDVDWDID